jgi:hypothetical protein
MRHTKSQRTYLEHMFTSCWSTHSHSCSIKEGANIHMSQVDEIILNLIFVATNKLSEYQKKRQYHMWNSQAQLHLDFIISNFLRTNFRFFNFCCY